MRGRIGASRSECAASCRRSPRFQPFARVREEESGDGSATFSITVAVRRRRRRRQILSARDLLFLLLQWSDMSIGDQAILCFHHVKSDQADLKPLTTEAENSCADQDKEIISSLACAQKGWMNIGVDKIACESCGVCLSFTSSSSWTSAEGTCLFSCDGTMRHPNPTGMYECTGPLT